MGLNGGGQFGLNGQKLHENEKISIFWVKAVEGHGGQVIFLASGGGSPQSPQLEETLINIEIPVLFDQK